MTDGPLRRLMAAKRPLLLDGALGTELEARGISCGLPLWSAAALLSDREGLLRLHRDYCAAGVDILTADTFRTTRRTFSRAGLPDRSAELTAVAVGLARQAAGEVSERQILVGGSIGPLEDCYRPDLVPGTSELRSEHAEHADRLAEAGADFLMLETIGTIREGMVALEEGTATGLETTISFLCRADGRLYGGESLAEAIAAATNLDPAAILVNCLPPGAVERIFEQLRLLTDIPLGAYANVGRPGEEESGNLVRAVSPAEYADAVLRWCRAGARIVGGCCGTDPGDIRLISGRLGHAI